MEQGVRKQLKKSLLADIRLLLHCSIANPKSPKTAYPAVRNFASH
jgi:hypothetical protein